jgi:dynein heavy chain
MLKRDVEPLEQKAAEWNAKLETATKEFDKINKELQECKAHFDKLKSEFDVLQTKKEELETTIENTKVKLVRAEKLNYLLADEGVRWEESVIKLDIDVKNVTGNVLLAAAELSYFGPLTGRFRIPLQELWLQKIQDAEVPMGLKFDLVEVLSDGLEIREWQNKGLPTDQISADNSIFVTRGGRWPFLIDPQGQANTWIKNVWGIVKDVDMSDKSEEERSDDDYGWRSQSDKDGMITEEDDLIVLRMDMPEAEFNNKIKHCLMNGNPLLIEDFGDTLEPMLDPIIGKEWFVNPLDKRTLLKWNEETIDFNDNFRCFFTTKVANPAFLPDVFIRTNIINFTVTQKGLEDQLLGLVVRLEREEVEKQMAENIEKLSTYRKTIVEIEKKI